MAGTPIKYHQSSPLVSQSQVFCGIRFVLLGFDPIKKSQVSRKLVNGGGVDAGQYGLDCTHVIVDKIAYDDPLCVAARQDDKILVSSIWVDHSFDVGAPVDTASVMYVPARDLNGIPGAKSLVICLTGYQREDREDIMTMVELMGAQFSKPLIATKVTHLICYKFEGEKYLLAKRLKRIKLINHRWLEDCLKAWEIIPEANYSKSGYELEMEAEARDSEDEPEGVTTRHNEGTITSPRHSLLSKQEIPKTISNPIGSNLFSNAQETTSVTMKTTSDRSPNYHETKIKHRDTENIASVTSGPSTHYGKTVSRSPAEDNIFRSSTSANKSPQNEAKTVISASYSMKDPIRTTPTKIDMKSNTSSSERLNKLNLNEAFNTSSSPVQKVTCYSGPAYCPEDEHNVAFSNKGKTDTCGSSKLPQMSQNEDVESVFQVLKKNPSIEMSSAQKPPSNVSGRKSLSSKGKNVICDAPISKTSNLEIENLDAVQRPQKEYNVMQSSSAVGSDLLKSGTLNSEINEQSAGSNSKLVRKKSISKKLSAPKLGKKNTVNKKGSIFIKNTDPGIDDENLSKYQQSEKVSSVAKSGTKIEGMQIEITAENKSFFVDDETEPPDDKDEAHKEKYEDVERESTIGNVDILDPSSDRNNDENDLLFIKNKVPVSVSDGNTEVLVSETPRTKKGKKNTALSMKEVTDKTPVNKNELMIDNEFEKHEIREEATPNQANRAHTIGNDFEKSMKVKRAGVCNDPELINDEKDADVDIDNVVNKKETKRNKHSPIKTKNDVSKRNATDLEKSVDVKKAEGVCNDFLSKNEEKDDVRADKVADVDTDNVLNKKETKRNKRPLSRSKKDDAKTVNKKGTTTSNQAVKTSDFEAQKENEQKDNDRADMDIEIVLNKKETNRNKRSLSGTKKDDTNTVNKKGKPTSNKAVKAHDSVEARKENVQIHVDDQSVCSDPEHKNEEKDHNRADMDLKKKETKSNKRPLRATKKDDAKNVNKKGKPTSNKALDLEEAQKENVQIHVNGDIGKKHVFKPAIKVNTGVLKDEPMWFILTGHNLQRKEFQLIIRRLKGRVCRVKHNWSYQATHFIVPDPIKRNEKFFAAAASGRWILKTDYLTASNQAGKFLPEETYEWHKKGLSEDGQVNLEAPRKWRLLKQKTGHGALYGIKIVIYGECISPPLDTLKRAVKAGDGTILATSPPYTRFLTTGIDFAVVSPGMPHVDVWVQEFLKHEIPCISADYLVEYVCKPGYPLEKHVQYGTNVWAERSYNSLKNRLEEVISEPKSLGSDDVACEVCGARDRGEEMLICGDESGLIGCGVGTHIGCCDPPLESVPEVDWFCFNCSKKPTSNTKANNCKENSNSKNKEGSKKKGSASRGK